MLALTTLLLAGCSSGPSPKLFVIGLDGATWDLIEPWIEAGELPNLKALRDESAWGTMNSVIPYLSPPAWTSAVTGVNPGRHGIYDFQRKIPDPDGAVRIVNETAKSRRSPPIWNMVRGSGLRVGIVNIPMTDPPDEVNGVMIGGMPHLDQDGYAYPDELEAEIEADGYLTDAMSMKLPEGEEDAVFQQYWDTLQERWKLVRRLYTEAEYDLFWVVFTGTDRMQHNSEFDLWPGLRQWETTNPANPSGFASEAYDAALVLLREATNLEEYQAALEATQLAVNEDVPFVSYGGDLSTMVFDPKVKGGISYQNQVYLLDQAYLEE